MPVISTLSQHIASYVACPELGGTRLNILAGAFRD